MEVYTYQIGKTPDMGSSTIVQCDITVKSGDKTFAPTWELLSAYKDGSITKEQYTESFMKLMRERYRKVPHEFAALAEYECIAFGCYCKPNDFCHRYLVVDIFYNYCYSKGIDFHYSGELT